MPVTTLAFLLALVISAPAQSPSPSTGAAQQSTLELTVKAELNAAAYAYRDGKFDVAEHHSRKAVGLDPNNKTARAFVARTVHAQFRPADTSEENAAIARQAIIEYKHMLELSPKDDEAFKAIAYLLGALKENEQLNSWILQRATDESFAPEKRAEAYTAVASKKWDCSFTITDMPVNKVTTVDRNNNSRVTYRMPKDPSDFQTAKKCASEGLTYIDQAIFLDPTYDVAWSYKYNLLLEHAKLSEMERKFVQKAQFDKLAAEALKQVQRLEKKTP